MPAVPIVARRVAWAELDSASELHTRDVEIPVKVIQAECQGSVSFAETVVEHQCFSRRRFGFRVSLLGSQDSIFPVSRQGIGIGQAGVRQRVVRIFGGRRG
jgi:hypothetical protein